jgi:hypothetical protein
LIARLNRRKAKIFARKPGRKQTNVREKREFFKICFSLRAACATIIMDIFAKYSAYSKNAGAIQAQTVGFTAF